MIQVDEINHDDLGNRQGNGNRHLSLAELDALRELIARKSQIESLIQARNGN